jgi:tripartite motif-containing protein 71
MKYRFHNITSICLTILFIALMGASITHAETYYSYVNQLSKDFYSPTGVTVDKFDNIYVVDTNNNCIKKFDKNGNFLTLWDSYNNGKGKFTRPTGVAVDFSGNIYVADENNHIVKLASSGAYITQWGSEVIPNSTIFNPMSIVVDSSGNVYTTTTGDNPEVVKFNDSGYYQTRWGISGYPAYIATDSSGNVYVTECGECRLRKFSRDGNIINQWGSVG